MLALGLALALGASKAALCPAGEGLVATSLGCVRGDQDGTVHRFRGIPYAAAPVGPLRWKAPQPMAPWGKVRDALAFSKSCPQKPAKWAGALETDEDCLTLNVWSPKLGAAAKLPVMVWIHGGGLAQGTSAQLIYDGKTFAEHGVVLVSLNYRLGSLGFFSHPALSAEDKSHHVSGNQGLLDQMAALRFVQANIAAFGGDPGRVTIFGESAGAMSVAALLASPPAKGLFAQAVLESGTFVWQGRSLRALKGATDSAEEQGARVARAFGCGEAKDVLGCLRAKTAQELLDAVPPKVGFFGKGEKFGFTVDAFALAESPRVALDAGRVAKVPVMLGTNADEGTLFTAALPLKRPLGFKMMTSALFGSDAEAVLAAYPLEGYASPHAAFDALVSDSVFTCNARTDARSLAKVAPRVFRYQFARVPEGSRLGAHHGAEIPFVFGNAQEPLAEIMQGYWVAFAKTEDPNHEGAVAWPKYVAADDPYLRFDAEATVEKQLRAAQCDVLDRVHVGDRDTEQQEGD